MNALTIELAPATRSLLNFLGEARPGAQPVTFTARTRVRLNKKHRETKEPCPYVDAWKTARVNAMLNCDYGRAVERRTGEPHEYGETWHEPVRDDKGRLTPCSRDPKTGALYLRVQDPKTLEAEYRADGSDPLDADTFEPYVTIPHYDIGAHVRYKGEVFTVEVVKVNRDMVLVNDEHPEGVPAGVWDVEPIVGFKVYSLRNIERATIDGREWVRPLFTFESPEE